MVRLVDPVSMFDQSPLKMACLLLGFGVVVMSLMLISTIRSHSVHHGPGRLLTTFPPLRRSLTLKSAVLRENGAGICGMATLGKNLRENERRSRNGPHAEHLDFLYEKGEAPRD